MRVDRAPETASRCLETFQLVLVSIVLLEQIDTVADDLHGQRHADIVLAVSGMDAELIANTLE